MDLRNREQTAATRELSLYNVSRHETLHPVAWSEERARLAIRAIVADAESRFSPEHYWPPHPRDTEGEATPPFTPLYMGALGMFWGLEHLRELGAAHLTRSYLPFLESVQAANRDWLGDQYEASRASFLMGDTPCLLMRRQAVAGDPAVDDELQALIAGNIDHPSRELMWGSPGTMLAALFLHDSTAEARWAELFRAVARKLWSQLLWSEEFGCRYWAQDLYGQHSTYLDAVHGFIATAVPLIKGRALLTPGEWQDWQHCIVNTVRRTATHEQGQVNWRVYLNTPEGHAPRMLMQFCHGAPGFVICLGDLPSAELDELLVAAGETTWRAGPLVKGSNLCHGTGGNGYAFLKLHRRTGDARWLDRARAFAMHGIAQTEADLRRFGQGRYSLWTGDVGFAIYLWQCLAATAAFPTLDVF